MKKLISNEIGANYTTADGRVALHSLFGKTRVLKDTLTSSFLDNAGLSPLSAHWLDSGRSGLSILLESLELNEKDEILLQAFSCVVVPNSTHGIQAKITILDVSQDTLTPTIKQLKQAINSNTKVLIWQYNFGIVQDMSEIVELCNQHNIILIEDCAHAIAQTMNVNGIQKPIGSIGDAGIFSFGRDKVISCTQGGLLVVNNARLKPKVDSLVDTLPEQKIHDARSHLRYAVAFSFVIRPFYHLGIGKRFKVGPIVLKIGKLLKLWSPVYTKAEKQGITKPSPTTMNPILFKLLQHQINKLSIYQNHRRAIQSIYASRLLQWQQDQPLLRYPLDIQLLIEAKYPNAHTKYQKNRKQVFNKLVSELEKRGLVLVSNWYTSIFAPAPASSFNYSKGRCKTAEDLINKRIINLPTNIHVSQSDARNMVDCIETTLASF